MNSLKNSSRIEILDSFRFLAILSVMFFHYYSRWTPPKSSISLYPYGSDYNYFGYGYLGVNFFFIISGFVITYTLYNTENIISFWKKRLARLLPAMVLCSALTLLVVRALDSGFIFPASHSLKNFLYSVTFLEPKLLDRIFRHWGIQGNYMNGSYWSLWLEIQFYAIASIVYFLNRKRFIENFSIIVISFYLLHKLFLNTQGGNFLHITLPQALVDHYYFWVGKIFTITGFLLWFLIGVLFFRIYIKQHSRFTPVLLTMVVILQMYDCIHWPVRVIFAIMLILFLVFIFLPGALIPINNKFFATMGIGSYSLYLIHENIGVLLINRYASLLGSLDFLFPVIVIAALILFSYFSYTFFEKPAGKLLKKI